MSGSRLCRLFCTKFKTARQAGRTRRRPGRTPAAPLALRDRVLPRRPSAGAEDHEIRTAPNVRKQTLPQADLLCRIHLSGIKATRTRTASRRSRRPGCGPPADAHVAAPSHVVRWRDGGGTSEDVAFRGGYNDTPPYPGQSSPAARTSLTRDCRRVLWISVGWLPKQRYGLFPRGYQSRAGGVGLTGELMVRRTLRSFRLSAHAGPRPRRHLRRGGPHPACMSQFPKESMPQETQPEHTDILITTSTTSRTASLGQSPRAAHPASGRPTGDHDGRGVMRDEEVVKRSR